MNNMMENNSSSIKRLTGKGVFPPKYAFTLLLPFRNIFLSPAQLIERIGLKNDAIVLEVGPGPGYFSLKVARFLTGGRLYLTDIQQEMLGYAEKRLKRNKIFNVDYRLCNGRDLPFDNNIFDVIFMVTVLGEIENKQEYVREFHRVLRNNGIVSVSEQAGDPDKMEIAEIESLFNDLGFKTSGLFGTKKNFTINFRKE
jgi:ubiquinone/menaquinone biosynthesis C-methylase UbiE